VIPARRTFRASDLDTQDLVGDGKEVQVPEPRPETNGPGRGGGRERDGAHGKGHGAVRKRLGAHGEVGADDEEDEPSERYPAQPHGHELPSVTHLADEREVCHNGQGEGEHPEAVEEVFAGLRIQGEEGQVEKTQEGRQHREHRAKHEVEALPGGLRSWNPSPGLGLLEHEVEAASRRGVEWLVATRPGAADREDMISRAENAITRAACTVAVQPALCRPHWSE